jgi:hypothetical protein
LKGTLRAAVVPLVSLLFVAALACSGSAPLPSTQLSPGPAEPRWEDAFDTTPNLLVVVFPAALRSDRVYGPLLRRAIALARQESRVVAETRALDAMEDADEVIVGLRTGASAAADDLVVVVRGVRADVDPVALVDAEGLPLWAPGPMGPVRELVRADATADSGPSGRSVRDETPASLFELPGRTWVIASGEARARARSAFFHVPDHARRVFALEGLAAEALVTIRIDGPTLVQRIPALQPTRMLGAVGARLDDVAFELSADLAPSEPPESVDGGLAASPEQVRVIKATLSYASEDAAALAEGTVHQVLDAIGRKKPDGFAWLSTERVEVTRPPPGKRVVVTVPLPPRLVDALLRAGKARLPGGEADKGP